MSEYVAPLRDMRFVIHELLRLERISALPDFSFVSADIVDAVLAEAGRLAADVIAPLNRIGDVTANRIENGLVRTPEGFRAAYTAYKDGGWAAVPFDTTYGGQGLPWLVATAVSEIWQSANVAFALCPLLTQGAVEALSSHASPEQKALYLPKLIAGEWTGTMNLTEPQAGSDLGALRTRAVREGDHYRITGQKIFITYGEHDLAENIIHLVLARTSDAPAGSKGISLFIVPKYLPEPDGSPGQRNDLRCVSLEHKLGIHASPTAVMAYGERGGAVGWLVGEENRGLNYMFTMMNNARLAIGMHGPAIGERAYQRAVAFSRQRVQGYATGSTGPVTIIHHPDVRRMLMMMRARTEAMRALSYLAAAEMDLARRHPDMAARRQHQATLDLLIPVVKGWCTDGGFEVASLGVQIHGGMGFVEETGVAQYLRDARIGMIYEGTNGIQALDLVSRKIGRDGGETARAFIETMRQDLPDLARNPALAILGRTLGEGLDALSAATDLIADAMNDRTDDAAATAVPYLEMFGIAAGGWLLARGALVAAAALAAGSAEPDFYSAKIATARFFGKHCLARAASLLPAIKAGSAPVMALADAQF